VILSNKTNDVKRFIA